MATLPTSSMYALLMMKKYGDLPLIDSRDTPRTLSGGGAPRSAADCCFSEQAVNPASLPDHPHLHLTRQIRFAFASRPAMLQVQNDASDGSHSILSSPTHNITSLDRLLPLQDHIFHYLQTDHPCSVLRLNRSFYTDYLPIVYRKVEVTGDGLCKLLGSLIRLEIDPIRKGRSPVYGERVIKALKYVEQLDILDMGNGEKVDETLRLWTLYKMDLIFPRLTHMSIGKRVITPILNPSLDPASLTGFLGLDVLIHLIAFSSTKTLCLDWPITEITSNDYGERDGSKLDCFIPELLKNLDQSITQLELVKVHVKYDNLGKMIFNILEHRSPWATQHPRPKIILELTNESNQSTVAILGELCGTVLCTMDELFENELHFDSTMIGNDITFILPDYKDRQAAIDEIMEEEVLDDYEGMWYTVLSNIVWKHNDNPKEWDCPCGKFPVRNIPDDTLIEDGLDSEQEDPTQTKIDQYFKHLT
ncbi:uncharacterized protein I206_101260 [Kwoniella pini CBS 10737]|uniref:Uncharacterized protein n=1 Tax=Kwoniella pini CBS 10737 TaxID=1296096 RepID=A0A1B9IB45_9TREE|nr:uncharacterized protein I206_00062 [Kwoniella pini CBS 10737]OCF52766.1 hypothetical protein I206_00062 [Kwoniella pini CBS 10737]